MEIIIKSFIYYFNQSIKYLTYFYLLILFIYSKLNTQNIEINKDFNYWYNKLNETKTSPVKKEQ